MVIYDLRKRSTPNFLCIKNHLNGWMSEATTRTASRVTGIHRYVINVVRFYKDALAIAPATKSLEDLQNCMMRVCAIAAHHAMSLWLKTDN